MSLPLGTAVVVAHGPTDVTLAAVRRASDLVSGGQIAGGRVLVVAGTEPGAAAVRALRRQGVETLDGNGSAALATAIMTCDDGPVLVVHDDVVIGAVGAEALLVAHLASSLPAVPLASAPGATADGFFDGRASLAATVAQRDQAVELARQGGFAPGLVRRGEWTVVRRAVIDHGGTCTTRLVDGGPPDGRPLLVAAMIVRDEAGFLPGCLASLNGVVDRVEIVDTGSTDHTVAIAEAAGANVTNVVWRNDFAWARNKALAQCTDAHYILWIDADERLACTDPRRLRRQLATYRSIYDALRIEIRNHDGADVTSTFRAKRIVRTADVEFVGAIHEQPRPLDRTAPWVEADLGGCWLDHLGYASRVMAGREKLSRNLELAEADWQRRQDSESLLHYLRTLQATGGEPERILALLGTAQVAVDTAPAPIRSYMLGIRGLQQRLLGCNEEAMRSAREALALVPADEVAQSLLADLLLAAGEADELLAELAAAQRSPSAEPAFRDRVARAARNRSIVCAAAQVGAWGAGVAAIDELPKGFDPWVVLLAAARGQADVVEGLAAAAAARDDASFGRAAALAPEPDQTAAYRAWIAAGGRAADVPELHEAIVISEAVAASDTLYDICLSSPDQTAVVRYALAAVTGAGDLCAEVERFARTPTSPVGSGADTSAMLLGIAAAAHERRGDLRRARRDAETSLVRWPGSPRAVAVLARLFGADSEVVVDLLSTARQSGVDAVATGAQLVELAELALAARADQGDFVGAVEEALYLVELDQPVPWPPLLKAAGDDLERQSVLVRVALFGEGVRFVDAMARTLRPETTAELCAAFLLSGGTAPTAVSTGLTAAIMRNRSDLVDLLVEHARLLDAEARVTLAAKLRAKGHEPAAERLVGALV